MEQCKLSEVNERIREAAEQAAAVDGLSVPVLERFLRTGSETWDGAGSGRFTLAQFKEDEAYTRAAKASLRTLLHLLASLLPAEAQSAPQVDTTPGCQADSTLMMARTKLGDTSYYRA